MNRKRAALIIAPIAVLLLAWWLWPRHAQVAAPSAAGPDTVTFQPEALRLANLTVEAIEPRPVVRTVTVTGAVAPDPDHLARIHPRAKGRVLRLDARVGDTVSEGQVLGVLASEDLHAAQVALRLALRKRDLAEATLNQKRQLAALGEYAQPTLETARSREAESTAEAANARTEAQMAAAGVAEARAQLDAARAALAQAEARRDVAVAKESRAAKMLDVGVVSKQDVETAHAERKAAEADVAAAVAALRQAETRAGSAQDRAAAQKTRARSAGAREQMASQARVREEAVRRSDLRGARELSEAEIALRQADIEVESARDEIALLGGSPGDNYEICVMSPIRGRVVERAATPGAIVDTSQAVYTVLSLARVWVQLDVFQSDLPGLALGQPVHVTSDAWPGVTFKGTVSYVSDVADETTRAFRVRAIIDNRDQRLRPGMFVSAKLEQPQNRQALLVPPAAVQQLDGRSVVFTASDKPGVFVVTPVETGLATETFIEIVKGLKKGDRVVIGEAAVVKAQAMKGDLEE